MSSTGHSRAPALVTGRERGRALPWGTRALPARGTDLLLWTLAVREDGRRTADAPVVDDARLREAAARDDVAVVLGHAGPEAGRWREARAVGPADVPAPGSQRRPRALDEQGWRDVTDAFAQAASAAREAGVRLVLLDASDDGLLASALSPLGAPDVDEDTRRRPLLQVLDAVRAAGIEAGVVLTVEELAPGGVDPSAGVETARACVRHGARLVVARAGTAWFPDLRSRPRRMGVDEPWLASALWLVDRVDVPVYAAGPLVDEARALDLATTSGLAGVVLWEVERPAP